MSCELCNLKKKTHWYLEAEDFIVCDCVTCEVPMFVWKEHKFPSQDQINYMKRSAVFMFPRKKVDMRRRKIPDHFHFHCQ